MKNNYALIFNMHKYDVEWLGVPVNSKVLNDKS